MFDLFVTNFELEHNTLYEQVAPGIWSDQTPQHGISRTSYSQLGFGTQAIDLDNDSYLELIIANGHVHHDAKSPSAYRQKMQILRRASSGGFEAMELAGCGDYFDQTHVGRSLFSIDANRDGRLDFGVTHQNEPLALLVNRTTADRAWLKLYLVGRQVARDAIGATVTVTTGAVTRTSPLVSGDGFYCTNERVLHFGLGNVETPDQDVQVSIQWPDGSHQKANVMCNAEYLVVQGVEAFALTGRNSVVNQ